jgi:hypothetical protein
MDKMDSSSESHDSLSHCRNGTEASRRATHSRIYSRHTLIVSAAGIFTYNSGLNYIDSNILNVSVFRQIR